MPYGGRVWAPLPRSFVHGSGVVESRLSRIGICGQRANRAEVSAYWVARPMRPGRALL
jgi:hypothetical protein